MYFINNEQKFEEEELSRNSSFKYLDLQSLINEDEYIKSADNFSTSKFSDKINDIGKSIAEPSKQEKKSETKLRMENLFDINNQINFENKYQRNYFKVSKLNNPRGRKRERGEKNKSPHDKYKKDNITTKIRVHSINFVRELVNFVLKVLGFDCEFRNISYYFKRRIKNKEIILLKKMAIKEIIFQQLSKKYKIDTNIDNKIIFESVKDKDNPIIKNILDSNYLDVFKKLYYYNHERKINLKDYGSDIDRIYNFTKKIKTFEDLLRSNNDYIYKQLLIECAKKNFLNEIIEEI